MTGAIKFTVHLLFDFTAFLLFLSVKMQLLVYQLMVPTSIQLMGGSIHTAVSQWFLVGTATLR